MSAENGMSPEFVLSGIKVVDFSRLLPGPWATQMMADFGAEVIKVEQPGVGDGARHNPPNYATTSAYFHSVNRNKRGIALDLAKPEAQAVAHKLIADADVVLESYRVGVTQKLGIDYETCKKLNDKIIYCSITGFGQDGPLRPFRDTISLFRPSRGSWVPTLNAASACLKYRCSRPRIIPQVPSR